MQITKTPAWLIAPLGVIRLLLGVFLATIAVFFPASMYPGLCSILMWLFGVHYRCVSGKHHMQGYRGILVFNHPTFYDHFVLMAATESPLSFVFNTKNFKFLLPFYITMRKLGCIPVRKLGGTTDEIKKALYSPTQKYPIAISPGGLFIPDKMTDMPPFRSGAFIVTDMVLPVILVYHPYKHTELTGSMVDCLWKRMMANRIMCDVHILEPMTRHPQENMEIFRDRVRAEMAYAISQVPVPKEMIPSPRILSALSSLLLFGSYIPHFIVRGIYREAIGLIIIVTTSMLYHKTDNFHANFLDILGNYGITIYMMYYAIVDYRNYLPLFFAIISFAGYMWRCKNPTGNHVIRQIQHIIAVHIPACIGVGSYLFYRPQWLL